MVNRHQNAFVLGVTNSLNYTTREDTNGAINGVKMKRNIEFLMKVKGIEGIFIKYPRNIDVGVSWEDIIE